MFKRRKNRQPHARLREAFWPSIGWRRSAHYLRHRVGRLPGTPYSIAAGFAYGAAISFTPLIGFHILVSGALSWISGASIVAAAIGTVVGNPWTFPIIWAWIYSLGIWLLGREPLELNYELLSLGFLYDHFWDIFIPMMVGGVPTAAVAWAVFYFPLKATVAKYQLARRRRRERKMKGLKSAGDDAGAAA